MQIANRYRKLVSYLPTAKSYIRNGLVTMWDGIENVGWGVHDANATNWIDLMGGIKVAVNNSIASFTDNSLYFPNRSVGCAGDKATPGYRTITYVIERTTWQSRVLFQSGNKRRQILGNVNAGAISWYFDGNRNPISRTYSISNNKYGDPSGRIDSITVVFENDSDIYLPTSVWHNGKLVSITSSSYNSNWNTGTVCRIGGATSSASNGTSGNIFNIRLYNRILTADEIAQNLAIDKTRFNIL